MIAAADTITNHGTIKVNGLFTLNTSGALRNAASLHAGVANWTLKQLNNETDNLVFGTGQSTVNIADAFTNHRKLTSQGSLRLSAPSIDNRGLIGAGQTLTLIANTSLTNRAGKTLGSGGAMHLQARDLIKNEKDANVYALGDLVLEGVNGGTLARVHNYAGTIEAQGNISLTATRFDNEAQIYDPDPGGYYGYNRVDGVETGNDLQLNDWVTTKEDQIVSETLRANQAFFEAGGSISIQASTINNTSSVVKAGGNLYASTRANSVTYSVTPPSSRVEQTLWTRPRESYSCGLFGLFTCHRTVDRYQTETQHITPQHVETREKAKWLSHQTIVVEDNLPLNALDTASETLTPHAETVASNTNTRTVASIGSASTAGTIQTQTVVTDSVALTGTQTLARAASPLTTVATHSDIAEVNTSVTTVRLSGTVAGVGRIHDAVPKTLALAHTRETSIVAAQQGVSDRAQVASSRTLALSASPLATFAAYQDSADVTAAGATVRLANSVDTPAQAQGKAPVALSHTLAQTVGNIASVALSKSTDNRLLRTVTSNGSFGLNTTVPTRYRTETKLHYTDTRKFIGSAYNLKRLGVNVNDNERIARDAASQTQRSLQANVVTTVQPRSTDTFVGTLTDPKASFAALGTVSDSVGIRLANRKLVFDLTPTGEGVLGTGGSALAQQGLGHALGQAGSVTPTASSALGLDNTVLGTVADTVGVKLTDGNLGFDLTPIEEGALGKGGRVLAQGVGHVLEQEALGLGDTVLGKGSGTVAAPGLFDTLIGSPLSYVSPEQTRQAEEEARTVARVTQTALGGVLRSTSEHGLFRQSTNASNTPVLQSNLSFINTDSFTDSTALLTQLDSDSLNELPRLAGDALVERRLIGQQLSALSNRALLDSDAVDLDDQIQRLHGGAVQEATRLGLEIGTKPSTTQLARLERDIIWLVEQEVNGQRALVPQVYLSQNTIEGLERGASNYISGRDVFIESTDDITNTNASIAAYQNLVVRIEGSITNSGGRFKAGNTLSLDAGGDIINQDGLLEGGELVSLKALGDIKNIATLTVDAFGAEIVEEIENEEGELEKTTDTEQVISSISEGGRIVSGGNVVVDAGGNFIQKASDLKATGDVSLFAAKDVLIESVGVRNKSTARYSNGHQIVDRTEQAKSTLSAGGKLTIDSGLNTLITASDIEADSASIRAGGHVALLAAYDEYHSDKKIELDGSWFGENRKEHHTETRSDAVRTTLNINGDISLVSRGGDVMLQAASIDNGGQLSASAEQGKLKFLVAKNTRHTTSKVETDSALWFSKTNKSQYDETVLHNQLNVAGGFDFNAAEGIEVEYKGKTGHNSVRDGKERNSETEHTRESLIAADPSLAWMQTLEGNDSVTWESVTEQHQSSYSKQEGMSGLAQALRVVPHRRAWWCLRRIIVIRYWAQWHTGWNSPQYCCQYGPHLDNIASGSGYD